jgi:CheY-like chemotaxis protein
MDHKPSVLYVEDDAQSRKVLSMVLVGRMGLPHVTLFEDSMNFLERALALEPRPEIILLDIHVDPLNGFEMLALLRSREEFSQTRIIAMTASVMNEEVQQLTSAGFDGCVAKPINLATFADTFAMICNGDAIWRITN